MIVLRHCEERLLRMKRTAVRLLTLILPLGALSCRAQQPLIAVPDARNGTMPTFWWGAPPCEPSCIVRAFGSSCDRSLLELDLDSVGGLIPNSQGDVDYS